MGHGRMVGCPSVCLVSQGSRSLAVCVSFLETVVSCSFVRFVLLVVLMKEKLGSVIVPWLEINIVQDVF